MNLTHPAQKMSDIYNLVSGLISANELQIANRIIIFRLLQFSAELDFIFYANETHVMYVPSNGGESTVIRSVTNSRLGYDSMTGRLHVYDPISTKLYSMKLDGSDSQELFGVGAGINRFSVDDINEKIYFIATVTDYTNSIYFDGTGLTVLLAGGYNDLTDIQVDPEMQ